MPVLLSRDMAESVQLIIHYRENAGVSVENPYLFGLPGNSAVFTHLSACELMRTFSIQSGIKDPEMMRGTELRKHIATQSALMDLGENEVGDLANFMGHADKIHRDHYRMPIVAREIGRVSQLLEIGKKKLKEKVL